MCSTTSDWSTAIQVNADITVKNAMIVTKVLMMMTICVIVMIIVTEISVFSLNLCMIVYYTNSNNVSLKSGYIANIY